MSLRDFTALAALPDPHLDELALALAAELRTVDADAAVSELDRLGEEIGELGDGGSPLEQAEACRLVLADRHGFIGDRRDYDNPDNSMLDLVLSRRRGLPILLSVVYVETARRAGIPLAGIGIPGHFLVGHFGTDPPLLLDPFFGGGVIGSEIAPEVAGELVRPWTAHETAMRMLNNLTSAYSARIDYPRAIRAAELRLALPLDDATRTAFEAELQALRARFN